MIAGNAEFQMSLLLLYISSLLKLPNELSDHCVQIRRNVHASYLSSARNNRHSDKTKLAKISPVYSPKRFSSFLFKLIFRSLAFIRHIRQICDNKKQMNAQVHNWIPVSLAKMTLCANWTAVDLIWRWWQNHCGANSSRLTYFCLITLVQSWGDSKQFDPAHIHTKE